MSQTITLKGTPKVPGATVMQTATWVGDTSYPNPAGYILTPSLFNLVRFKGVPRFAPRDAAAANWDYSLTPTYDATGEYITQFALHINVSSTGLEVANGVTVATAALTIEVEGN
jgi:hypothetical protein